VAAAASVCCAPGIMMHDDHHSPSFSMSSMMPLAFRPLLQSPQARVTSVLLL